MQLTCICIVYIVYVCVYIYTHTNIHTHTHITIMYIHLCTKVGHKIHESSPRVYWEITPSNECVDSKSFKGL